MSVMTVSPGVWVAVNAAQNKQYILQLIWALIVVGDFIKFTVQTLNAQLSEMVTDHQKVNDYCSLTIN